MKPRVLMLSLVLSGLVLGLAGSALGVSIYMMSSSDAGIDNAAKTALEAFGHTVTIGVQYKDFDTESLAVMQVVYLQANANYNAGDMPVAGQNALLTFLGTSGRGLVTNEWVLWKTRPGSTQFSILKAAFPATNNGEYRINSPVTYTQATGDPILNAGLPVSFDFPVNYYGG